jgi:hypothetical protein
MQETSHKEITLNTRLNNGVKHVHSMICTKFDFSRTLGIQLHPELCMVMLWISRRSLRVKVPGVFNMGPKNRIQTATHLISTTTRIVQATCPSNCDSRGRSGRRRQSTEWILITDRTGFEEEGTRKGGGGGSAVTSASWR